MSKIQELRDRAKNANYNAKSHVNSGPKVGEGEWKTLLTKAECSRGQNGAYRGLVGVKVLDGVPAPTNTESLVQQLGGEFNIYIQTKAAEYLAETLEIWAKVLLDVGVKESKIFDEDLESDVEILTHFMSLLNNQVIKGKDIIVIVKRTPQKATAPNGTPYYYNDILNVMVSDGPAEAPPATVSDAEAQAMVDSILNPPAEEPKATEPPAVAAPAAATGGRKPWQK